MNKVKEHLKKHKVSYMSSVSCLIIGTAVGVTLRAGLPKEVQNLNYSVQKLNWKPKNTQMIIQMTERSTPSKPVHLVGTNLYFESLNDAARKTGHSLSMISKHINGHIADLKGDVFELLEKA